jgi:hypothetical protein
MSDGWWRKAGAFGGLGFVIVQLVAQGLIQAGGSEPAFAAGTSEIVSFFQAKDAGLFQVADFLNLLSLLMFIWFLGSLWSTLGGKDNRTVIAQVIAVGSGLMALASSVGAGGWSLAMFRIDDLDPQLARYLFDQGNYGFANLWGFTASMLLASGIGSWGSQSLPRWLNWLAIADAFGLLAARAFWATESGLAFLPYMVFWVWLIAVCVRWLRRPTAGSPAGQTRRVA